MRRQLQGMLAFQGQVNAQRHLLRHPRILSGLGLLLWQRRVFGQDARRKRNMSAQVHVAMEQHIWIRCSRVLRVEFHITLCGIANAVKG